MYKMGRNIVCVRVRVAVCVCMRERHNHSVHVKGKQRKLIAFAAIGYCCYDIVGV